MSTQTYEIKLSLYTETSSKSYHLISSADSLTLYFEVFKNFKDVSAFGGGDILSIGFTEEDAQKYLQMITSDERTTSVEEFS